MTREILMFLVSIGLALQWVEYGRQKEAVSEICRLVQNKIWKTGPEVEDWVSNCHTFREQISIWTSRATMMRDVGFLLRSLEVSHLLVYDPDEDRRVWRGVARENGLRVRRIESQWVVFKILAPSPAAESGLRPGAVIQSINGEEPRSAWHIQTSEGQFQVIQDQRATSLHLATAEIQEDQTPSLAWQAGGRAVLSLPSFRKEFFVDEIWRPLLHELSRAQNVLIDLRGNAGGNMVSMLRAITPFVCQGALVGRLKQPRKLKEAGSAPRVATDELSDEQQLEWLSESPEIEFRAFDGFPCLRMPVAVLVDRSTASVAEIFAEGLRHHRRAKIAGEGTAGDVVIAVWYALPRLGPGYSLSIPEAIYLSPAGDILEGRGVWPDLELEYRLDEAVRGEDSWVQFFRQE